MQCRVPATTAVDAMPFTLTLLGIPFAKEKKKRKLLRWLEGGAYSCMYYCSFCTIPYHISKDKGNVNYALIHHIIRTEFYIDNLPYLS